MGGDCHFGRAFLLQPRQVCQRYAAVVLLLSNEWTRSVKVAHYHDTVKAQDRSLSGLLDIEIDDYLVDHLVDKIAERMYSDYDDKYREVVSG